jgi:hypothetical protein
MAKKSLPKGFKPFGKKKGDDEGEAPKKGGNPFAKKGGKKK